MGTQESKSWGVGCVTSLLSGCGCSVLGTALAIGCAWVAWEVFEIREDAIRGDSAIVWGPLVGLFLGLIAAGVMLFVGRWLARLFLFPDPPAGP